MPLYYVRGDWRHFECPTCGGTIEAKVQEDGNNVECPHCGSWGRLQVMSGKVYDGWKPQQQIKPGCLIVGGLVAFLLFLVLNR